MPRYIPAALDAVSRGGPRRGSLRMFGTHGALVNSWPEGGTAVQRRRYRIPTRVQYVLTRFV